MIFPSETCKQTESFKGTLLIYIAKMPVMTTLGHRKSFKVTFHYRVVIFVLEIVIFSSTDVTRWDFPPWSSVV